MAPMSTLPRPEIRPGAAGAAGITLATMPLHPPPEVARAAGAVAVEGSAAPVGQLRNIAPGASCELGENCFGDDESRTIADRT